MEGECLMLVMNIVCVRRGGEEERRGEVRGGRWGEVRGGELRGGR